MATIVYTFQALLNHEGKWKDSYFLTCNCGYDFEGVLDYDNNWYKYTSQQNKPFTIEWKREKCQQTVSMSFPDCHCLD